MTDFIPKYQSEFADFWAKEFKTLHSRIDREKNRWIEAWMAYLFCPEIAEQARLDPIGVSKRLNEAGVVMKRYPDHDELWGAFNGLLAKIASFRVGFDNNHMNITADYPPGFKLT